jgi:hypothetical protein
MNFHLHRAKYAHERRFTERLRRVIMNIGHRHVELDKPADFAVQWGADRIEDIPTLHCELGWMPRWGYQMSWHGINAAHTHAGEQALEPVNAYAAHGYLSGVQHGIGAPAGGWGYCDPRVPPTDAIKADFFLCPLQVPNDTNMRYLPRKLRTPQGMIDYVSQLAEAWNAPVYFKQHPASTERNQSVTVKSPNKYLPHNPKMQVASLLKARNCLGVIAGNSNVVHDAILWEKPVSAMGGGFWGKAPIKFEPYTPQTWAYVEHVRRHQWHYKHLAQGRVKALLEEMP